MKRVMWIIGLTLVLLSTNSLADSVIRDGNEWLQPISFSNLSWDEIASVCPPPSGLCNGSLGSTDVTGFIWASVDEINALFNSYGIVPPIGPGPDEISQDQPTPWVTAFFQDFEPTFTNSFDTTVRGYARTREATLAYAPRISRIYSTDLASTAATYPPQISTGGIGAYLYKPPAPASTPVPTTPTYVLILIILGLLTIATRQISRRQVKQE